MLNPAFLAKIRSYIPVTLDQVHTTFIKNGEKLGEPTKNLYNAAES